MENTRIQPDVTNAVKLTKNSKGYTWEIKMREDLNDWKKTIDVLKEIDDLLKKEFEGIENAPNKDSA